MGTQRFANVLQAWEQQGHTRAEFSRLTRLNATGVGRMFDGEQRPTVETLGQILLGVVDVDRDLARQLLEGYLMDCVPDGTTPDGRDWLSHVRIIVDDIGAPTLREQAAEDPVEAALARFIRKVRTTAHGRSFILGIDKWTDQAKE